jgi:hypothetical protein
MTTTHPAQHWSTLDLELYIDGHLEHDCHAALTDDLRQSPALRQRLSDVSRIDSLAALALSTPTPATVVSAAPPPARRLPLLAAAILLLATIASILPGLLRRPAPVSPPHALPLAQDTRAARPDMVVFSIAVRAQEPAPAALAVSGAPDPSSTPPRPDFAGLCAAFEARDAVRLSALLTGADEPTRNALFDRMTSQLRSNDDRRAILEGLAPDQQLAACARWVRNPASRPVAFQILAALARNPATQEGASRLLAQLDSRPECRPWIASLRSLAALATPAPRAG